VIDPRVQSVCDEFGIKIVDARTYPGIRETRAVATMENILEAKGYEHFRLVMMTLGETENNQGQIDEYLLYAVSDLVAEYAHLIEDDASKWLSCFDRAPIGELQYIVRRQRKQRHKLFGMISERIYIAFGPKSVQPDLFDDRARRTA
jgi:hypothetical protein